MKALTIYQPWASLVIAGAKPYEFRGWNPRERGPAYAALIGQRIAIHASAKVIDRRESNYLMAVLRQRDMHPDLAAETCLIAEKALPILSRLLDGGGLPRSCILGTGVLGEPRNGIEIAEEFGVSRANDSDRDAHANWGWPMLDIEPFETPIPARGFQGFWNWQEAHDAAAMFG
ncbi:MAG: hypothetical protein U9R73_00830 [Pseudomonadota bacterium]|nr:hypothetical protein [Pseudomonadota bacterium]